MLSAMHECNILRMRHSRPSIQWPVFLAPVRSAHARFVQIHTTTTARINLEYHGFHRFFNPTFRMVSTRFFDMIILVSLHINAPNGVWLYFSFSILLMLVRVINLIGWWSPTCHLYLLSSHFFFFFPYHRYGPARRPCGIGEFFCERERNVHFCRIPIQCIFMYFSSIWYLSADIPDRTNEGCDLFLLVSLHFGIYIRFCRFESAHFTTWASTPSLSSVFSETWCWLQFPEIHHSLRIAVDFITAGHK